MTQPGRPTVLLADDEEGVRFTLAECCPRPMWT